MSDEQVNLIDERIRGRHFHLSYLVCLLMTISIGTFQFGFYLGSWNTVTDAYAAYHMWGAEKLSRQAQVQTASSVGVAVGALISGPLSTFGKLNGIIMMNLFLLVGSGVSLVENYYCFIAGRLIYAVSVGGFSVFCPKYINETSPKEISGPIGTLSQVCITSGILFVFILGLIIGDTHGYSADQLR